MAICPFATWKPLPANAKQGRMVPRVAILHTAVDAPGPTDLYGWFVQSGLESHFFVHNNGGLTQYMDTTVVAEANYRANGFAVSIETEDDGHPESTGWNPAMLATIVRLLDWLCQTHSTIPRRQCDRWDGAGVGWHSMWGLNTKAQPSVNPWTTALGKSCPGAPRIAQIKSTILPSLVGRSTTPIPTPPQEEDLSYNQWPLAERQALTLDTAKAMLYGIPIGYTDANGKAGVTTVADMLSKLFSREVLGVGEPEDVRIADGDRADLAKQILAGLPPALAKEVSDEIAKRFAGEAA